MEDSEIKKMKRQVEIEGYIYRRLLYQTKIKKRVVVEIKEIQQKRSIKVEKVQSLKEVLRNQ